MSWRRNRLLTIAQRMLPVGLLVLAGAAADSAVRPRYPQDDLGKDSLPSRQKAQMEAARQFKVIVELSRLSDGPAERSPQIIGI